MRRRILSAVIAGGLILTSIMPVIPVSATPESQEVTEARNKYEELKRRVAEIETQIITINGQIEPLVEEVSKNKAEISNIEKEVESTNKEVEQAKIEIAEKEEILGERLREIYKSGGQTSYLTILFTADSFSDLISKIDSAGRLVSLDKKVVSELQEKKNKLDEKVASLEDKAEEIKKLNEEVETKLAEFQEKKKEQDELIAQAEVEQAEFDRLYLSEIERQLVSTQIATCNNSNSSLDDLKNAISQLKSIGSGQIKSPTVSSEINAAIQNAQVLVEQKQKEQLASSNANRGGETVSGNVQAVLNVAYAQISKPYVWGATGPNSFDCSGLTQYAYANGAGIAIGRTTWDQVKNGKVISSMADLQPGDLIFTNSELSHVGMYVGGGNMIHAPRPGKNVEVVSVYAFYTGRRIIQ